MSSWDSRQPRGGPRCALSNVSGTTVGNEKQCFLVRVGIEHERGSQLSTQQDECVILRSFKTFFPLVHVL